MEYQKSQIPDLEDCSPVRIPCYLLYKLADSHQEIYSGIVNAQGRRHSQVPQLLLKDNYAFQMDWTFGTFFNV